MAARHLRRGAAGLAIFLALLVAAFAIDATWLRPLIQHHVDARSHRRIDFSLLRFGLTATLDPTITLRGLQIENAAWAAKRPFARAGEARFVIAWNSLWGERITVKQLSLADADIDMERQPDGLRNWRLTKPDDRGPGRVDVLSLVARRSAVRFVHQGIALEVETRIDPLAQAVTLSVAPTLPLTQRIAFHGSRSGAAFDGELQVSDVLTFLDTGLPFAARGSARSGDASLRVEGLAMDIRRWAKLDVDLRFAAKRLSDLAPLMAPASLPSSSPVAIDMRLKKSDRDWHFDALTVKVGTSQMAGTASLREAGDQERRQFSIDLRGQAVAIADLTGWRPTKATSENAAPTSTMSRKLDLAALRDSDGSVDLHIDRLTGLPFGDLQGLKIAASLRQGVAQIEPATFMLGKGRVDGSLRIDAQQPQAEVSVKLAAQGVRLEPLIQALKQANAVRGDVNARLTMSSRGDSLTTLMAAADGSAHVGLVNASMPAKLEAKLGLDAGRWLAALVQGEQRVALRCAQAALVLKQGRGTIQSLLLQTDKTRVVGGGRVELLEGRFDLLLTPRENGRTWLALDRSIHLSGVRGQVATELVPAEENLAVPACDTPQ